MAVIRDALAPHKDALLDKLWLVAAAPEKGKEQQRLRAASALAKYDPHSENWSTTQKDVANDLVRVPAVYLSLWMDALRPVRTQLIPPLSVVFGDAERKETERSLATDILADYAADQPEELAQLAMIANPAQFAVIFPKLQEQSEKALPVLALEIDKQLPVVFFDKEKLAKRQANAAVALLKMGQAAKVWPLLKYSRDPRVRSYLIHKLGPLGAEAGTIIGRLEDEPDITIRRALILSLGEFTEKELSLESRKAVTQKLQAIYRTDADPGLHAASEWLLRTWKEQSWLKQQNDAWAKDKVKGEGWWVVVGKDKDSPPARHPPPPSGTSTGRVKRWW